jgi:hypothetical protein
VDFAAKRRLALDDAYDLCWDARVTRERRFPTPARVVWLGGTRDKPGLWRYLRVTKTGLLRIDRAKIAAETKLDGKTLLRTSELEVDAADIARG